MLPLSIARTRLRTKKRRSRRRRRAGGAALTMCSMQEELQGAELKEALRVCVELQCGSMAICYLLSLGFQNKFIGYLIFSKASKCILKIVWLWWCGYVKQVSYIFLVL
jgi:ribosomal protein L32